VGVMIDDRLMPSHGSLAIVPQMPQILLPLRCDRRGDGDRGKGRIAIDLVADRTPRQVRSLSLARRSSTDPAITQRTLMNECQFQNQFQKLSPAD
jgi:hypothetical protein